MNWEAIGAIAELLGAIGVIATLLYLASQIRHNTAALHRNEVNTAMEQWSSFRKLMLSDESFNRVFLKGLQEFEALDELEHQTFNTLMTELFHLLRHTFDRSNKGLIDATEWELGTKPQLLELLGNAGAKSWWQQNKEMFPADFTSEVEGA